MQRFIRLAPVVAFVLLGLTVLVFTALSSSSPLPVPPEKSTTTPPPSVRQSVSLTETVDAMARERWKSSLPQGESGVANLQRLLGVLVGGVPEAVDSGRYLIVIDVGGNVGQTSSRLMTEIVRKRPDFVMLTYEPMKAYDAIVARAVREHWNSSRYAVFQCAVGASAGTTTFYYDSDQSEQSSQDAEAAGTAKFTRNVSVITMDQFFHQGIPATIVRTGNTVPNTTSDNILFYKIDTEGYDMEVLLLGSTRLLRAHRVRFLEFEYNSKWFSRGRNLTLRQVVSALYDTYGYECYFISERYLHPVFDAWWRQEMEIRAWSNAFCGLRGDRYLHWIVRRFDHQDFSPLAPVDFVEFSNA